MSRNWSTVAFFDRQAQCTLEFLHLVTNTLMNAGLVSRNPDRGSTLGGYLQNDEYNDFETQGLAEAFAIMIGNRGGSVALWHPTGEFRMDLHMYPCGVRYPQVSRNDAYAEYGWSSFSVDSTFLTEVSEPLARERYLRVFRWSQVFAATTRAVYGWGDLDRSGELDRTVRASDLANSAIPRVSWWAYYGKQFLERRGKALLYSPGISWVAWDVKGGEPGFVVILHPPEWPREASKEEGVSLGLR
jgi:hypothetical protein